MRAARLCLETWGKLGKIRENHLEWGKLICPGENHLVVGKMRDVLRDVLGNICVHKGKGKINGEHLKGKLGKIREKGKSLSNFPHMRSAHA